MDLDELRALARLPAARVARVLFSERERPKGYTRAALQIREYAACAIAARMWRHGGQIAQAMKHEAECERIYQSLPEFARW
jgi:hypothetical protein